MQMPAPLTVLQVIFSMASETLPITRASLGRRVGLAASELEREVAAHDRAGFIDAGQLRLTLPGLAMAAAMRASSPAGARVTRIAA
jgi:hypothetical protein